jgi:hypothetical protein
MKLIKTQFVKGILFAVIVTFSVQCFAQTNTPTLREQEMLRAASKHLILNEDKYVFDLSESEAEKSGISASYYARFVRDIEEVNNAIKKAKNNPEVDICLADTSILLHDRSDNLKPEIILNSLNITDISSSVISIPANTSKIKVEVVPAYAIISCVELKIMNTGGSDVTALMVSTFLNPATIDIKLPVKYPYIFPVEALIKTSKRVTVIFKTQKNGGN